LEAAREKLKKLSATEFSEDVVAKVRANISEEERNHRTYLQAIATPDEFRKSLELQSIEIEREVIKELFKQQYVNENVLFEFEAELDLQEDALLYPEVYEDLLGFAQLSQADHPEVSVFQLLLPGIEG
jgi:hypothetical protein